MWRINPKRGRLAWLKPAATATNIHSPSVEGELNHWKTVGNHFGKKNVSDVSAGWRNDQDQQHFDAAIGGQTRLGCDCRITASTYGEADAMEKSRNALEEHLEQDQTDKHAGAESGIGEFRAAGGPLHGIGNLIFDRGGYEHSIISLLIQIEPQRPCSALRCLVLPSQLRLPV